MNSKEIMESLAIFMGGELTVRQYQSPPKLHRGRIESFDIIDINTLNINLKWCALGVGGDVPDGNAGNMVPEKYLASNEKTWQINIPSEGPVPFLKKEGLTLMSFDYEHEIEFIFTPKGIGQQLDVYDVEDMQFIDPFEEIMSEKEISYLPEEMRGAARILNALEVIAMLMEKFQRYGNTFHYLKLQEIIGSISEPLIDPSEDAVLNEITFNEAVRSINDIIQELEKWENETDAANLRQALAVLIEALAEPVDIEEDFNQVWRELFATCYDVAVSEHMDKLAARIKEYVDADPAEELNKNDLMELVHECRVLLEKRAAFQN